MVARKYKGDELDYIRWDRKAWLASKARAILTPLERGIYRELCDAHYAETDCTLPDDDHVLAALAGCDAATWATVRDAVLKHLPVVEPGKRQQPRCLLEWREARKARRIKRKSGGNGASKRWGDEIPGTRSDRMKAAREKGTHTDADWDSLVAFCGGLCVRCGSTPNPAPVKDHIRPIYKGGSDGIENLQPLCRGCNSSKGPEMADFRPPGWMAAVVAGKTLADHQRDAGPLRSVPFRSVPSAPDSLSALPNPPDGSPPRSRLPPPPGQGEPWGEYEGRCRALGFSDVLINTAWSRPLKTPKEA